MSRQAGETEVIINGQSLALSEEMTLWCAVNNFLISLREQDFRDGLGESLAQSYIDNLAAIARKWLDAAPTTPKTRYGKDCGEGRTMPELMGDLGMMIDSGASSGDLVDYLDREFFGGAWGFLREYMSPEGRHHMRMFEADMRGAIVAAYDAALERNGSEAFQRFKLKLEVRMREWKDQRAIDDVLELLELLPKPDGGRQPEMRYEHRIAPVKLDLAALARGESGYAGPVDPRDDLTTIATRGEVLELQTPADLVKDLADDAPGETGSRACAESSLAAFGSAMISEKAEVVTPNKPSESWAVAQLNPPAAIHVGNQEPAGVRPYIDMVAQAAAEQIAKQKKKEEPDLTEALGLDEPDGGWSRG